jgi:hypothetical protein
MDGTGRILFLLSQGEISSSLLKHIPAGELITLARTNSLIRADLHDFGEPHHHTTTTRGVRHELQIGHHETARWKQLKQNAAYECSSSSHTKGTDVKPCRYCSKLICGACMTRASFANPGEKTFQNRCRSLCESCWVSGNRHQRQKLTDDCECSHTAERSNSKSAQDKADDTKTCECTNKNDGWVCLDCKHLQNKVWFTNQCFGEGCSNPLDSVAERRKICMWCDKPLPITATRENPHVYKQKVVEAMAQEAASRQADLEAHALRRRQRQRMTLRELRGDEAVSSNPLADIADLVRDLDTVNYPRLLGYDRSPTSSQVYNSKLGKWQYKRSFLLAFRSRCDSINVPLHVKDATRTDCPTTAERTNRELFSELNEELRAGMQKQKAQQLSSAAWEVHRGQITRMRYLERRSVKEIQRTIFKEHGLWESDNNYRRTLTEWKLDAEVENSRTGISGLASISNPDRDIPRYWQDVGSASRDAGESIHEFPRRRDDEHGESHRRTHTLSDGLPQAPQSANITDPTAPMSTSQHTTTSKFSQPIHPTTTHPSHTTTHSNANPTPTLRRDISHILSDLRARHSALALEETHSDNPEALEQILAERAALQLEWEEALLGGVQGEEDVDDSARGVGERDGEREGSMGDTQQETEQGGEGEEYDDDVALLIAIQESLMESEGVKREVETEPEREREGIRNENEQRNDNEQGYENERSNEDEPDENEHVDAHSYENWNMSRADGRPPIYFA